MVLRDWPGRRIALLWALGLALEAGVVASARVQARRHAAELDREIDALAGRPGARLLTAAPSIDADTPVRVFTFDTPAAEAARLDRLMRRQQAAEGIGVAAFVAIASAVVVLTASWLVTRARPGRRPPDAPAA